jgi:hypothetical protein
MTLLIQYRTTTQFPRRNENRGECLDTKFSSWHEQPDFQWKPSELIEVRDGVPLAQVRFVSGSLPVEQDFRPPFARALARPHIASGATIPGNTVWELWRETGFAEPIGVQVTIDTSAAGFTQDPCYFSWLQGPLWNRDTIGQFTPFEHIAEAKADEFTFLLLLEEGEESNNDFIRVAQEQALYISWLGIQPEPTQKAECEDNHGHS